MTYTIHHRIVRYKGQEGYGIHTVVFKGAELVAWNPEAIQAKCGYNAGPPGILNVLDQIAHAVASPIVEELDWACYQNPHAYIKEAVYGSAFLRAIQ